VRVSLPIGVAVVILAAALGVDAWAHLQASGRSAEEHQRLEALIRTVPTREDLARVGSTLAPPALAAQPCSMGPALSPVLYAAAAAKGEAVKPQAEPPVEPERPRSPEQVASLRTANTLLEQALATGRLTDETARDLRHAVHQAGSSAETQEIVRRMAEAYNRNALLPPRDLSLALP
jgi:hypothetical protein